MTIFNSLIKLDKIRMHVALIFRCIDTSTSLSRAEEYKPADVDARAEKRGQDEMNLLTSDWSRAGDNTLSPQLSSRLFSKVKTF